MKGIKETLRERYREDLLCSILNLKTFQEEGFGQQCRRLGRSLKKKKRTQGGEMSVNSVMRLWL